MNDTKTPSARWYVALSDRLKELSENLGITDDAASELKEFVFTVARDQYKIGNSSGIRWARMNP